MLTKVLFESMLSEANWKSAFQASAGKAQTV